MATTQPKLRPHEHVTHALRERIRSGGWRQGEMIPSRRDLARHYSVALTTVERSVATLISEGLLEARDRCGTFVNGASPAAVNPVNGIHSMHTPGRPRNTLTATVGIVARVIPYKSMTMRTGQWPAQILAECEHGMTASPGVTQRFFNLVQGEGQPDIAPATAVRELLANGADGLVLIGAMDGVLPLVEAAGISLVYADYDPLEAPVPQVHIDSVAGGAQAARHLRERGYRQLTYLRPFTSVWSEARLSGALAVVGHDALRVFPRETELEVSLKLTAEAQRGLGLEVGRELLLAGFEPGTGVIAPNDSVAVGFMDAARERGLEAGRDYGLVGFDDMQREAHLTSLRPPLGQLGREAAALLLRLLAGEDAPARIVLQHRLIARASTLGTAKTLPN